MHDSVPTGRKTQLDEAAASAWFVSHVPDANPPLTYGLIAAGRSNLTFRVQDQAGSAWVLRRPPHGNLQPTAHDMSREYRIISALHENGEVPVPEPIALCEDVEILGAPFHITRFVDGHVLRSEDDCEALSPAALQSVSDDLARVLASIHTVDIDGAGLGDLGRREEYLARQLRRWAKQFQAATGPENAAILNGVHDDLARHIPQQQAAALVHGDYRLDNAIVDEDGRIVAVLDWELCTLGDPLADVGQLLTYWPSNGRPPFMATATTAPGLAPGDQLVDSYGKLTGLDLSALGYYRAFAHWKIACILDGVYERYQANGGGGSTGGVDDLPDVVGDLARRAREGLEHS